MRLLSVLSCVLSNLSWIPILSVRVSFSAHPYIHLNMNKSLFSFLFLTEHSLKENNTYFRMSTLVKLPWRFRIFKVLKCFVSRVKNNNIVALFKDFFLSLFRISQRLRVVGSLTVIMLVFIVTAIIVKVPLEPLPFFCVTMVKIVIINCGCFQIVSNRFWTIQVKVFINWFDVIQLMWRTLTGQ